MQTKSTTLTTAVYLSNYRLKRGKYFFSNCNVFTAKSESNMWAPPIERHSCLCYLFDIISGFLEYLQNHPDAQYCKDKTKT
jgi:hypothetical protein